MPNLQSFHLYIGLAILLGLTLIVGILHIHYKLVVRRGAKETYDEARTHEREGAQMVDANPDEFTWLDIGYYDELQNQLEQMGFRYVGDFENLTDTHMNPYMRRFSRVMSGRDGTVLAVIFMIRVIRRKMPLKYIWIPVGTKRVIAFTSTTEDDIRMYTSNTKGVAPKVDLPGLIMQEFPPDTPPDALLDTHESAMRQVLEHQPDIQFRAYHTREQVLEEQREEDEWMRSCDAYQKIAEASLEYVTQTQGLEEVGREMHVAYLHEKQRRNRVLEKIENRSP